MTTKGIRIDAKLYPLLHRFSTEMGLGKVISVDNREDKLRELRAAMSRPVISNALLLGEAGTGKTALVEYFANKYTADNEHVFELDVVSMAQNGRDQFNAFLKRFMDEIIDLQEKNNLIIDVFIDEFHVVAMNGGTDAIKPILARSGILGVHMIAATTDDEYFDYIKPNPALDQRLQPIKLAEPTDAEMLPILRNTVSFYEPEIRALFPDKILKKIISYGKYQPDMFQPRKSILFVDALIGDYRALGIEPTLAHLNERLTSATGIQADWKTDVDKVVAGLRKRVKGQDVAIDIMKDSLNVSVAGIQDPTKPMGSYLFAGTTGTGKTELTKSLAKLIFGSEKLLQRYDMSEYQTQDSVATFQERVTTGLTKQPYTILLFDELEKAHAGVRNLLLQLLDDGRMSNRYGHQISGLNAYVIMTTNLGAGVLADVANKDGDVRDYQQLLFSELAVTLSPEFLGRLSAIVPFQPLSRKILAEIAQLRLDELNRRVYSKYGITLKLNPETYSLPDGYRQTVFKVNKVLAYIVADRVIVNANNGGGRAVSRRIDSELSSVVASILNKHNRPRLKYDYFELKVEGKMVLDDIFDAQGSAHITVTPHLRQ